MKKLLFITAISFFTLLFSVTSFSQNLKYKGYGEINYSLGMGTPEIYSGIKGKPADIGLLSTSHGILLADKFFVGIGGSYNVTLKSGGESGFGVHGDLRYNIVNFNETKLFIGGRAGLLFTEKVSNVSKNQYDGLVRLKSGLTINPFISLELPVMPNNNLVISAGYRSQFYKLTLEGQAGKSTQILFNDDFEYLNFSIGVSF